MGTLLIGGNGLVGTKLVKYFSDIQEELVVYSGHAPALQIPGVTYYQGDVTEYGTLNQILHNHKIDRIIHNAAVSHPKLFRDNPYKIFRINTTGTLIALEAARNFGIRRFIYISSGAVYGNVHLDTVTEDVKLHGESPYGASKVACEEIVRNYGLETASLRLGFVYGPGRRFECPIQMLLNDCMTKHSVNWTRGMDQVMDYVYVDDCVKAIAIATMAQTLPHTEYNIGGGENVPYSKVVECVSKLYPHIPINIGSGTLGYDNLGAMSMNRFYQDFGWKPQVSIEDGIVRYNNWLRQTNCLFEQ